MTLLWIKRLWHCPEQACLRQTWSEVSEHVRPRASLTERARREACRLVGEDGVDETAFPAAGPRSATQFVTGIVAMPGPGRPRAQLLDIVPGRSKAAVPHWFGRCDPAWKAAIATASLDPFRGYATALTSSLPQAVRVLDAFHVVRLGQTAVDEVRRRRQQETLGRRGHRDDPLYRVRRDLRRGLLTTTARQWARIELAVTLGDPSGQLAQAYMAAQELQFLYARSRDRADAAHRLYTILDRCARSDVPELHRLAAPWIPGAQNC